MGKKLHIPIWVAAPTPVEPIIVVPIIPLDVASILLLGP
jgi:hypothetical protein